MRAVVDAVGERATVVAGVGHLRHRAQRPPGPRGRAGGRARRCSSSRRTTPGRPQEGLLAHFTAVADATGLPVMLYDIPPRSVRRRSSSATLQRLAEHPRIVAVKDAKRRPAARREGAGHHRPRLLLRRRPDEPAVARRRRGRLRQRHRARRRRSPRARCSRRSRRASTPAPARSTPRCCPCRGPWTGSAVWSSPRPRCGWSASTSASRACPSPRPTTPRCARSPPTWPTQASRHPPELKDRTQLVSSRTFRPSSPPPRAAAAPQSRRRRRR